MSGACRQSLLLPRKESHSEGIGFSKEAARKIRLKSCDHGGCGELSRVCRHHESGKA